MAQLGAGGVASSTTFSNPVYEMEESDTVSPSTSVVTASTSRTQSFTSADVRPEPSSAVIGNFYYSKRFKAF